MQNSILIQSPLNQFPVGMPTDNYQSINDIDIDIENTHNINRNLFPEFENVFTESYINETVDNLLISHFLVNYNVETIYNINPNIIENEFERSLLNLMISTGANTGPMPTENCAIETQLICLESAEELAVPFECGICYEFCPTFDSVGMNCRHNMCKSCMKNCLSVKNTCPFCRQKICVLDVKDPELMNTFA